MLVTDGKSAIGQAMAKALVEAGADIVWVGVAEPWKQPPGLDRLEKSAARSSACRSISPTRSRCAILPGSIGGKVDILINTAEFHRTHAIADRGTETARAEMEVNYLGLLRLAQAFGPAMRARAAEGRARDRLGQSAVDLRAVGAAVARHVLGLEGRGTCAVAKSARRDAPRRHPRGECLSRPDRR